MNFTLANVFIAYLWTKIPRIREGMLREFFETFSVYIKTSWTLLEEYEIMSVCLDTIEINAFFFVLFLAEKNVYNPPTRIYFSISTQFIINNSYLKFWIININRKKWHVFRCRLWSRHFSYSQSIFFIIEVFKVYVNIN